MIVLPSRIQTGLALELLAALNSNVHMFSRFFLTLIQPHETGSLKNISTNRIIVYLSTVDKLLPQPQREILRKLYPPQSFLFWTQARDCDDYTANQPRFQDPLYLAKLSCQVGMFQNFKYKSQSFVVLYRQRIFRNLKYPVKKKMIKRQLYGKLNRDPVKMTQRWRNVLQFPSRDIFSRIADVTPSCMPVFKNKMTERFRLFCKAPKNSLLSCYTD